MYKVTRSTFEEKISNVLGTGKSYRILKYLRNLKLFLLPNESENNDNPITKFLTFCANVVEIREESKLLQEFDTRLNLIANPVHNTIKCYNTYNVIIL